MVIAFVSSRATVPIEPTVEFALRHLSDEVGCPHTEVTERGLSYRGLDQRVAKEPECAAATATYFGTQCSPGRASDRNRAASIGWTWRRSTAEPLRNIVHGLHLHVEVRTQMAPIS
jgi:hypothetical protein